MFELLEEKQDVDGHEIDNVGCLAHFKFFQPPPPVNFIEPKRFQIKDTPIRHRRKYAATMLLQKWNSLRNLNILRHQLGPLLDHFVDDDEKEEKKSDQQGLINMAKKLDLSQWKRIISETNNKLKEHLSNTRDGWQLLTEYDIHRVDSMEIVTKQFPFFESFMDHFLLKKIKEDKEKEKKEAKSLQYKWYQHFENTWRDVPEWWTTAHDVVLIELALKYNIEHLYYVQELTGEKASDFMMRLRKNEKNAIFIPGHNVSFSRQNKSDLDLISRAEEAAEKDELKPYLEFQHWCRQRANILHRLKYITNIVINNLDSIKPTLISIRIPAKNDQPQFQSQSIIFTDYERIKHIQYVERERRLKRVDNYTTEWTLKAMQNSTMRASSAMFGKKLNTPKAQHVAGQISKELIGDIRNLSPQTTITSLSGGSGASVKQIKKKDSIEYALINSANKQSDEDNDDKKLNNDDDNDHEPSPYDKMKSLTQYENDTESDASVSDLDDPDDDVSDEDTLQIRIHDPFIHRNLTEELHEAVQCFDMIKYGPTMAQFIIMLIKQYNIDELWITLAVVMEAMPFPMALKILRDEADTLKRGNPEHLLAVCDEMVSGTNFGVAAALRIAEYFREIGSKDAWQKDIWKIQSEKFEQKAHVMINDIESDHLLYILLSIPLYDTKSKMSIIQLALEQKRISFLNNERILGIMKHVWYYGQAIPINTIIQTRDQSWSELLQTLTFRPFKFYMSPVGFNWAIASLYLLYLLFVLLYSYLMVKNWDNQLGDFFLWLFNLGYVTYEISEWSDKGRAYFSVSGIMNIWDIMISALWIVIFVLQILYNFGQLINDNNATPTAMPTESPLDTITPSPTGFVTTNAMLNNDQEELFLVDLFTILFSVQLFLLSTRFLTLFQNTYYLGGLFKIFQLMFKEILKFLSVAAIVMGAFAFGFYFINGFQVDNSDEVDDFWPTILFTINGFLSGEVFEDGASVVGSVFAIGLAVVGMLILSNLLIALMTTEYERFQETALQEVTYMWIETVFDLSHRDRLIPPPLNLAVYIIALIIHIIATPFAVIAPTTWLNLYTHINYSRYVSLNEFYCGCNSKISKKINDYKKEYSETNNDKKQKMFAKQAKKIYDDRFGTFLEFSGWVWLKNKIYSIFICCKCDVICCCCCKNRNDTEVKQKKAKKQKSSKNSNKKRSKGCKYRCNKYCRKCCCQDDISDDRSLTAYHKGCYNCIKLRVKDTLLKKDTTTIRGITMKEYIHKFEYKNTTKLQKADKILLKHLTVDTLFCDQCYQPYLESHVDDVLLSPFRVLLDFISCVVFLFSAWIPLVLFFSAMTFIEFLQNCAGVDTDVNQESSSSKSSGTNNNNNNTETEYEEFDREYFPHPMKSIII